MKVTAISVTAGRTFNHPFEQYANLRFDMHLNADLEDGEEPVAAIKTLTAQAEELAEGHKQDLLKDIRTLEKIQRANREISDLEERMASADARLKDLRRSVAAYQSAPAEPFELGHDESDDNSSQGLVPLSAPTSHAPTNAPPRMRSPPNSAGAPDATAHQTDER